MRHLALPIAFLYSRYQNGFMHLSRHHWHFAWISLALLAGILVFILPKKAHSQPLSGQARGYYTTTTTSTSTSVTDASGATTTTTNSSTNTPRDIYSSRGDRNRWRDRDRDPDRTRDIEARYPYDNTGGRNRSDVDAVRSGFDDPRNPWDGRYTNDNPRNSANSAGSNGTVNQMRGNEQYRPGSYGTTRVRQR